MINNCFYPSPQWATEKLLEYIDIKGNVLECCSGDNDIAKVLFNSYSSSVYTNDIDSNRPSAFHLDSTLTTSWNTFTFEMGKIDWVVTNPPFSTNPLPGKVKGKPIAFKILQLAYEFSNVGVAFLMRKSFSEPCVDRREFLKNHRNNLACWLNLERMSFTRDGKTDNTSCDFFVYTKKPVECTIIDWCWK